MTTAEGVDGTTTGGAIALGVLKRQVTLIPLVGDFAVAAA